MQDDRSSLPSSSQVPLPTTTTTSRTSTTTVMPDPIIPSSFRPPRYLSSQHAQPTPPSSSHFNYSFRIQLMLQKHSMFNPLLCTKCESDENVLQDRSEGTMVCRACGLVVTNHLIDWNEEEKRDFHQDENAQYSSESSSHSRVGQSLFDMDENTVVMMTTTSSRNSNGENVGDLTLGTQIANHRDKQFIKLGSKNLEREFLFEGFTKISDIILNKLKLESKYTFRVKQLLKILYTNHKHKLNKKTLSECIGACLYCGLKAEGIAKTLKEYSVLLQVKLKSLNSWISLINKDSDTRQLIQTEKYNSPQSYVEKFADDLKLSTKVKYQILEFIEKLMTIPDDEMAKALIGKSPATIAAVCILIIGEKEQIKDINLDSMEGVSGITKQTLSRSLKLLNK
ncbi:hypothetical protein FDP41_006437 [Naegleria fowleri]|uniref:General transcription factor TFIIB n=1 Tax=Naegleria fowleri TaxID=5763 RepID=A0A6A5BLE4_NAEFO|nr:uncharacterized protein FDP41_006437 [Naegleria fowleri]KAF0974405.1 hypothetical protein FDP41_006437 [Naegleria fowleri]CAG4712871.1 unnamed protein product [Naegleria fowleri]